MKYPPKKIGLRHIDWVGLIVATELPSLSKLLAYQLSSYMNRDQNIAWPSQARLMAESSMSKGALNNHLKLLEDEGWIIRQSGNHSSTTRYQIAFPKHIERVVQQMDKGSIGDELPSSPDGLGVVQEMDTNISLNIQSNIQVEEPQKRNRFAKPSLKDVYDYINDNNLSVDPNSFINYYESTGWCRGKTKIKDWKACVRTWESRNKKDNIEDKPKSRKQL